MKRRWLSAVLLAGAAVAARAETTFVTETLMIDDPRTVNVLESGRAADFSEDVLAVVGVAGRDPTRHLLDSPSHRVVSEPRLLDAVFGYARQLV